MKFEAWLLIWLLAVGWKIADRLGTRNRNRQAGTGSSNEQSATSHEE
jgi:hypothetical protein